MRVHFPPSVRRTIVALLSVAVLLVGLNSALKLILRRKPKRVLEVTRRLFGRAVNPVVLWFDRRFHLNQSVVYHVGRKTGREYATPLCVSATPEGFIVPAAFGPDVDWLRNLRVAKQARLVTGGITYQVEPEVIDAAEALRSAGGKPGCPCWQDLQVEQFVRLRPIDAS